MVCGSCGPKTLTVEQMKNMTSEQIIAAYRQGYKLVQGGASQPQVMSQDWQYGGRVQALPFGGGDTGTCTPTPKQSGNTVNLSTTPNGGVAPYDVRFWKSLDGASLNQTDITGATQTAQPENVAVLASYTLTDTDVAGALGGAGALAPSDVNTTTGAITLGGAAAVLTAGAIRFYTSIIDSCTGSGGKGTCAQYCDVSLACAAPTCSFVVT